MELFNKFKKTIFYKENNDLERQLEELKRIRSQLEDTTEIDQDIKLLEYGIFGEKQIHFELDNANIGMYVLHDITFENNGNKAQIDYLILTKGYFYLVECKNLLGNITVDSNGQFYREYEYKGKMIKEAIYSPYTQAMRHHDMMKKVWSANHSKLDNFLFGGFEGKDFFKPLVVLANPKSILNTKDAPQDIKDDIIRVDQLINYIKKDIKSIDKMNLFGEKALKKAAEVWSSRSVPNDMNIVNKYLNKLNILDKNEKENLENKLRTFRKEKSESMNVPPYYVFNDEEMHKLINKKPKSIEELKNSKIIPEIKMKCHGEEIIRIINS